MAMLLDDIIDLAVDNRQPLSVLLRKCILLAHELKNDRLRRWANGELNGYPADEKVIPEYRVLHVGARGNFSGSFGSALRSYPIPPIVLNEKHRHFCETVHLLEGVSSYEHMLKEAGTITYPWPADFVVLYQEDIYPDYVLINAWQEVPKSAVAELLDTIRTRTLNMALDIKAEVGNETLRQMTPFEMQRVEQTIITQIFGGTNIVASGGSQVNADIMSAQNVIHIGDRAQLDVVLKKAGLSDDDLSELSEAQKVDGTEKLGSGVMAWIKKMAPKAVVGGVKVASGVAQQVLTEYLKQHYGLT